MKKVIHTCSHCPFCMEYFDELGGFWCEHPVNKEPVKLLRSIYDDPWILCPMRSKPVKLMVVKPGKKLLSKMFNQALDHFSDD